MLDQDREMIARVERLESLVGTAYNRDGTVRQALEAAAGLPDLETMRQEVRNVIGFLHDTCPNPDKA